MLDILVRLFLPRSRLDPKPKPPDVQYRYGFPTYKDFLEDRHERHH